MQAKADFNEKELKLMKKFIRRFPYQQDPDLLDMKDKINSTLNLGKFQTKAFKESLRAMNNMMRSIGAPGRYYINSNDELCFVQHEIGEDYKISKIIDIESFSVHENFIKLESPKYGECQLGIFGAIF